MKKIYECPFCHELHPCLKQSQRIQIDHSQAIRFADLFPKQSSIVQPKFDSVSFALNTKFEPPKAHPQNMTLSANRHPHKNKQRKFEAIEQNQFPTSKHDWSALSIRKRFKTRQYTDQQISSTPQQKQLKKTSVSKSRGSTTNIKPKNLLSVQSIKTKERSTVSIKKKNHSRQNKMNQDGISQNTENIDFSQYNRMISEFHKSQILKRLHQSQLVSQEGPFNREKSLQKIGSDSEYSFSGKKNKLNYPEEMDALRKILKQAPNKTVYPGENQENVSSKILKIGQKYYAKTPPKKQACTLFSDSCFGLNMCYQEGETQIIQLPELYI